MVTERFVVGKSEDVARIYGHRASHPFTMLLMVDGRVSSIEGFRTMELLNYTLTDDKIPEWQVERLSLMEAAFC